MYVIVIKRSFCDSDAWYSRFSVSAWYTQVLNGCLLDDLEALPLWLPLCHSEGGLSSSLSSLGRHRVQLEYRVQQCGPEPSSCPRWEMRVQDGQGEELMPSLLFL